MSQGPRARALLEVCVADVDGAIAARDGGADRLELCADLASGGTTPSLGMVAATLDALPGVPVRVMIRPVGGRFALDDTLLDVSCATSPRSGLSPRRRAGWGSSSAPSARTTAWTRPAWPSS